MIDSWQAYERDLARDLLPGLEPDMLVIADRGFYSYDLWNQAADSGASLLWRVKKTQELPVLENLPDGSYTSRLVPRERRQYINKRRRLGYDPYEEEGIPVRVVEYKIPDRKKGELFRLVTNITDHTEAPAEELAALYAERWEFELGLDEIEIHQVGGSRVLRSKKPELVRQEIWGLLITHYAIRDFMREAADDVDIDPDRISFIRSLRIIRRAVTNGDDFPPESS